jgi:DNA polymerase I-like protein with 3'-5' exonuclease and polymerase domains
MKMNLPDKLHGVIALDLETKDDGLREKKGPGWPWYGGHVVGYAVVADNFNQYLPIAHEGGGNLDPDLVHRWLNDVMSDEDQLKVFANAQYDLGWCFTTGVRVRGPIRDVQWVAALLDEHRWSYSLDALARDYLGKGKDERELNEAAQAHGYDPKADLWRLPASSVARYAAQDANLTRELWDVEKPLLEKDDLLSICELEHDLLPLYLSMRRRGVRVDVDYTEQLLNQLRSEVEDARQEIYHRLGIGVDLWAARSVAKAFDACGLTYGRTVKTKEPSITIDLLKSTDHWLSQLLLGARQKDKLAGTFLENVILKNLHGDRVHGEIHPLRSDDGGTVTGRLSMSNPNLQFIPKRTEEGKRIRKCFIPDEGDRWASLDFSQQEPRLVVHFAAMVAENGRKVEGALEARDRYLNDPNTNYHEFAASVTGLPYHHAKAVNLAIIYGRGIKNTAAELQRSVEETKEIFRRHHKEMPFAKAMATICQEVVRQRGYLRSLLGRHARFPFWEPREWSERNELLTLEKARERWPKKQLVRARLHKALNSLIQPSAADQTKAAMREIWKAGLGDHLLIQIHDELCCTVPSDDVAKRIAELMRTAVKLKVPSVVETSIAERWSG